MRALRIAAEDAKIELSRGERAQVTLAQPLVIEGQDVQVDLELTRATVEGLCAPLVDRALDVCVRLLTANGLGPGRLARIVLVGGPTVMPLVRNRVAARLEAPLAEGHDPMTLVAQGAALYAATAGLDGRAALQSHPAGRQVWLQYPAVSSDLTPHVVGKFVGADPPAKVKLLRTDGAWSSPEATVGPDGTFLTSVTLLPLERIVAWANGDLDVYTMPDNALRGLTCPPAQKPVPWVMTSRAEAESECKDTPRYSAEKLVLIRAGDNIGFAAGTNIGIRFALSLPDPGYIWILNNDTVIEQDALSELVQAVANDPYDRPAGSVIYEYRQPSSLQIYGGLKVWKQFILKPSFARMNETFHFISGASLFLSRTRAMDLGSEHMGSL